MSGQGGRQSWRLRPKSPVWLTRGERPSRKELNEEATIMMYGGWGGWNWMMMLMPLLWIVIIGLIVWAAVRFSQRPSGPVSTQPGRETPHEILDRRFASGEIDAETYTRARDTLAGRRPQTS
jgi:putative membrane protein